MLRLAVVLGLITLLAAESRPADNAFTSTTPGAPGLGGVVPTLSGDGAATPNSENTLRLTDAAPGAPALLVFSMSELAAPFAGGVLGPAPDFITLLGLADAAGALERSFRMPPDAPAGLELYLQAWIRDAAAVAGLSASNTLRVVVPPSTPTALLFPGATYLAGSEPGALLLADFDGDGVDDVVVVNTGSAEVSVLPGCGDGTLAGAVNTPLDATPTALAAGHLDDDGHLDLVVGHDAPAGFVVWLGNGDGSFEFATASPTSGAPSALVLADLDVDGALDLAVATPVVDEVATFLGSHAGQFAGLGVYATGSRPVDLAVADVDQDGLPDLLTCDELSSSVSLLRGLGSGAFAPAEPISVLALPQRLALGDVDADGDLDLAVVSDLLSGRFATLLGDGSGAFGPPIATPIGSTPNDLWLGDLDGDGLLDAVVSDRSSGSGPGQVETLLGAGDGSFALQVPPVRAGSTAGRIALGDLDGDGDTELLVASAAGFALPQPGVGVSVFQGDADGSFETARRYGMGKSPLDLDVGDFDGDGLADVAVLRAASQATGSSAVSVRFGMPDGTLGPQTVVTLPQSAARVLAVDLDADGLDDLVCFSPIVGELVYTVLSQGGASFGTPGVLDVEQPIWEATVGDVDGDGHMDLAGGIVNSNMIWIASGDGAGGFGPVETKELAMSAPLLRVLDVNGDGIDDLLGMLANVFVVVLDEDELPPHYTATVLLGTGGGEFAAPLLSPAADTLDELAVHDVDGDGALDLVMLGALDVEPGQLPVEVLAMLGDGTGLFAPPTSVALGGIPGGKLRVGDVTGDGLLDAVTTGPFFDTVQVVAGRGDGSFDAPQRFLAGRTLVGLGLADFDHDGLLDMVTAHFSANNVWLSTNMLGELRD